jgi:hypothetical protein
LSSQSVMTLARADAGMATASDAPIKAAGIERQINARMVSSIDSELCVRVQYRLNEVWL